MAGQVEASNFTGAFAALNGSKDITATRADIIRSLLTVGYPSRKKALRKVGPWRVRMLSAMAYGYLDRALTTTQYFRNLEQTEKVGVSFLLGEAFTHWFAQDRMGVEFLVHVAGLNSTVWGASSAAVTPKTGASPPSPKSRPDFIGVRKAERHVFESKGRIRGPAQSAISKALGQVSALRSINGTQPATRCATFFMLKAAGTEGKVIDPDGDANGVEVIFDEWEAVSKTYSFFITGLRSDLPGQITAQVTENIFDTPTGGARLIPQGAKLIGIYDSQVAFGQSRVLLVWTRLIMPNGRSIVLERQQGADAGGYSGLEDEIDNHWAELFKAALLSTILGVGAELGSGADTGSNTDIIQALRLSAANSLNQTGQQVVRRNLNIQPTLTIRPGFPVRVIVNRDLVLEPYRG
jgi:hypothetical protein